MLSMEYIQHATTRPGSKKVATGGSILIAKVAQSDKCDLDQQIAAQREAARLFVRCGASGASGFHSIVVAIRWCSIACPEQGVALFATSCLSIPD